MWKCHSHEHFFLNCILLPVSKTSEFIVANYAKYYQRNCVACPSMPCSHFLMLFFLTTSGIVRFFSSWVNKKLYYKTHTYISLHSCMMSGCCEHLSFIFLLENVHTIVSNFIVVYCLNPHIYNKKKLLCIAGKHIFLRKKCDGFANRIKK